MNATHTITDTSTTPDRRSLLPYAVGAFMLAAVLTAVGTFLDLTGNEPGDGSDELGVWLALMAGLAVITYIVYRYWYERAAAAPVAPNSALVGGVLAAALFPGFWTGLPTVFAVGAFVLGRKGGGVKAIIGMALSVLAVLASVGLAVAG